MITRHQNKRGDFVFHLSFQDKDGNPVEPPQRFDIRLSVSGGTESYVAEFRADGICTWCKKVTDGVDVFVALSRTPIGTGRMILETVSYLPDGNFPGGERHVISKTSTSVLLWDGPSDGDIRITGTIIL